MDFHDGNWQDYLQDDELLGIDELASRGQMIQLPENAKLFLDNIPRADDTNVLLDHIDNQRVNPAHGRALYFLKTTSLYGLYSFRTSSLSLSDQGERERQCLGRGFWWNHSDCKK